MENYKKRLSPIRIGNVEVKNRIVMSPMGDGYSTDDGDVKGIGQVHEAIFTGFNAAWNLDANNAEYI